MSDDYDVDEEVHIDPDTINNPNYYNEMLDESEEEELEAIASLIGHKLQGNDNHPIENDDEDTDVLHQGNLLYCWCLLKGFSL